MSWQRILEIARHRGMPMIVTDIAGREPLVVLSLDEYESLNEGGGAKSKAPSAVRPEPVGEPVRFEPVTRMEVPQDSMRSFQQREFDQYDVRPRAKPVTVGPVSQAFEPEISAMPDSAQVSLENPPVDDLATEERFYLEPSEDETN